MGDTGGVSAGCFVLLRLMPGLVDLECVVVLRNVKLDALEH